MKYSVVIPFCNQRLDNLYQTLRFLSQEKIASECELILVCQSFYEGVIRGFHSLKILNLNLNDYWRAKMCNEGVKNSQGSIIILLDSDRVLQENYFTKVCNEIKKNQCITTQNHWRLMCDVSDEQILTNKYIARYEPKSVDMDMHRMSAFSGNTVFFRDEYLDVGGMDESYIDYGYQDIDFSRTMMSKGKNIIFLQDKELHLFHQKSDDWKYMTVANGIKYCKKWGLEPQLSLIEHGKTFNINVLQECFSENLQLKKVF